MKKIALFIIILSVIAPLLYAQSEGETESEVNLGTSPTKKPIVGFTVVVAEDAKVATDGKTTYVEDVYTYVGRKFKAVEARLKKIEAVEEELRNRADRIEKRLTDVETTLLISKEPVETAQEGPPRAEQSP